MSGPMARARIREPIWSRRAVGIHERFFQTMPFEVTIEHRTKDGRLWDPAIYQVDHDLDDAIKQAEVMTIAWQRIVILPIDKLKKIGTQTETENAHHSDFPERPRDPSYRRKPRRFRP